MQELPSDYEDIDLPDMGERTNERDRRDNSSGNDDNSSSSDDDGDNANGDRQEANNGDNVDAGEATMAGVITNIVEKGMSLFEPYCEESYS